MLFINKIKVTTGVYWIEVPEAKLFVLCGSPADSVKHLMLKGLIVTQEKNKIFCETGPNAILLSDLPVQNGCFTNLAEFPVLQMLYRQGIILPNHPNNTGEKPILIGSKTQVKAQMQYIYRGNYGLVSEKEIIEAGIEPGLARDMMRMKLRFAFGKIRPSEELLDSRIIDDEPVEIKNEVFVKRLESNVFEFQYKDEKITVDLNLKPNEKYPIPYPLGFQNIKREYFAVAHSGEGDGWDVHRPTMSSIIMFQGKIFLIDAGPNMSELLVALGISVNEIEGIFHTHAHDDHFCGLPALMRTDHKIKYYATKLVRHSVIKKLNALESMDEDQFYKLFDVHDLNFDEWNNINGLLVKPIFSPHPLETSIFIFKTICEDGYRTYGHFADIVGLKLLKDMITDDDSANGVSEAFYERVKDEYLQPMDLKKLDIGGGMIHGYAEDFRNDHSKKIILAHTALELTDSQKEIGSSAPFGTVDTIIEAYQDIEMRLAFQFLKSYFPTAEVYQIQMLLNSPVLTFNPHTILLKSGVQHNEIYLILTGNVEMIHSEKGIKNILPAGSLIGEMSGLTGIPLDETYRAASFVQTLCISASLYYEFVNNAGLYNKIESMQDKRQFLQSTWLFGEAISYPIQNKLVHALETVQFPKDYIFENVKDLYIVTSGKLQRIIEDDNLDILDIGSFFGEESIIYDTPSFFKFKALENIKLYKLKSSILSDIPIVQWKLLESYEKHKELVLESKKDTQGLFFWREIYSVCIPEMDAQHKNLISIANNIYELIKVDNESSELIQLFNDLLKYTETHFKDEEALTWKHNFPDYEAHCKKHKIIIDKVIELKDSIESGKTKLDIDVLDLLKDWILNHIIMDDRKYGHWINVKK